MKNYWMAFMLFVSVSAVMVAQEKQVSGNVTDQNGLPLPGVSVVVVGTTSGTQTDFDGNYSISVNEGQVLRFSYLGQKTVDRTVGATNTINIQMEEDAQALQEVIVVAYGTQKKEEITGSVATVGEEELSTIPSGSVTQGLVGKVSGVQIINQSGAPGADPSIRFRGVGSINSSNEPLLVVDGVVFNGNLNSINQQDIESINFLKDASANALYGSRGANGVLLVTTKRAKTGRVSVTFDTRVGFNTRAVPEYNIITGQAEYYEAAYNAWRVGLIDQGEDPAVAAQTAASQIVTGGGFSLGYNAFDIADDQLIDPTTGRVRSASALYPDVSWQDAAYITGFRTENYLSLSQSTDNTDVFMSLGHLQDDGILINSGFERTTARITSEFRPVDGVRISGSLNYAHTDADNPLARFGSGSVSNVSAWARNTPNIYPIFQRDEQGGFILDANGERIYDFGVSDDVVVGNRPGFKGNANPIGTSLSDIDENLVDNLSGRFGTSIRFLKDFEFTYNLSMDLTNANLTRF
ncbi:MAG: SusC/RagA family TonB-linked outer membrane protein, partial [Bacteroidota bacterium]